MNSKLRVCLAFVLGALIGAGMLLALLTATGLGVIWFASSFKHASPQPFEEAKLDAVIAQVEATNAADGYHTVQSLDALETLQPQSDHYGNAIDLWVGRSAQGELETVLVILSKDREFVYGYAHATKARHAHKFRSLPIGKLIVPDWWEICGPQPNH